MSKLQRLAQPRPWQTNAALCTIGFGLILCSRQLLAEWDHYVIGDSGVSSSSVVLYAAALLLLWLFPRNTDRFTVPIILCFAILARYAVLFHDPFLSTDVYRYAWDGVVQHAGISPYRYVPGNPALTFLREPNQDLFDNINRRDYAVTIYPPAAQVFFYLVTFISPQVNAMKAAMVLLEGVTVFGLFRLMDFLRIRRHWILLYAWCPMLIWEIGSSGHLDSLVMATLTWACVFRLRRQPVLTGICFTLAVLTKFYPLVVFPALLQRERAHPEKPWLSRPDWKMPSTLAGLTILLYLPYLSAGRRVFGFMGGYVQEEGMSNGTRYFLLEAAQHLPGLAGLSSRAYTLFCLAVLGALSLWAWRTTCPDDAPRAAFLRPACYLATGFMLLFSPHYPWYLAWLVPFVVLLPSLTTLTYINGLFYLCTTALAVGYGPKQFHLNVILYTSILIALLLDLALHRLPQLRPLRQGRFVEPEQHPTSLH
jgi:hypothetical protein